MTKNPFLTGAWTLPEGARQHPDKGAETSNGIADRETILKLLNDARAVTLQRRPKAELEHDNLVAEGTLSPDSQKNSGYKKYITANLLVHTIERNLAAEHLAINSYREMLKHLNDQEPKIRCLLESILAIEEKHAAEMSNLLGGFPSEIA